MKTKYKTPANKGRNLFLYLLLASFFLVINIISCTKYDDFIPGGLNADLNHSTDNTSNILTQKGALSTTAVTFNWTTGSNFGTNTSINYELQVDLAANNFSSPIVYDMGKEKYSKKLTVDALNDTILNYWNLEPGTEVQIVSRVVAHIHTDPESTDTSNISEIAVTAYEPVTTELFLVGDATPNGWDIVNATELTPDKDEPTIFKYKGAMRTGHFKLPVNTNSDWGQDMYMRDPNTSDSTKIYLHKGGNSDDNQWEITKAGMYKIEVSLCDLTIKITPLEAVEFTEMYMAGDATPGGWDISNATKMIQDEANPNIFRYNGMLYPGDFKFPVNKDSGWGQDVFMRDPADPDSLTVYRHTGGESDDNKWHIYKEGFYSVELDLQNLTIAYKRIETLFIIGSATSAGWTIADALALTPGSTSYEFIFTGALTAGDFKFLINGKTGWTQNMFMKDASDDSKIYFHQGGASDDNKWTLTGSQAGNYVITLNLKELTIDMNKQ